MEKSMVNFMSRKRLQLLRATVEEAELIWQMQVEAFADLLEKYQDMDTNPANEPIEKVIKRLEALKAFLGYLKAEKNIEKVYGICVSENVASKRVLEKSGFIKEYEGLGNYQGKETEIVKYLFGM